MYALKIITTILVCFIAGVVLFQPSSYERDKEVIVGYIIIELSYILSLICMWA